MRAAAVAVAMCAAGAAAVRDEAGAKGAAPGRLTVLIYDSAEEGATSAAPLEGQLRDGGWEWKRIGRGDAWQGFGTKVRGIIGALAEMQPSQLVAVTDTYDVLLNPFPGAADAAARKVAAAVAVHPGAVFASAESQCCVNALSRTAPGGLIAENGTRTGRACSSRSAGCEWRAGGEAPWVEFMTAVADKLGPRSGAANPFLNAGGVAGRAGDLLAVYSALKAAGDEDDQALLTEFFFRHPDRIVLDYDQELFGNNRWRVGGAEGCVFDKEGDKLVHRELGSSPAFIHASGQFWDCYRRLADAAGVRLSDEARARKSQPLSNGYMSGDPFTSFAGKRTQFYLPLGEEVKLMTCDKIAVHGRTMPSGVPGDSQQWFDKVRVVDSGAELASVAVGALRAWAGAAQPLTTIAVNISGTPVPGAAPPAPGARVSVHRDEAARIGADGWSEWVHVTGAKFAMEVRSAAVNKAPEAAGRTHLDVSFPSVDASTCIGVLPEIWGVRPMTPGTARLLTPPQ